MSFSISRKHHGKSRRKSKVDPDITVKKRPFFNFQNHFFQSPKNVQRKANSDFPDASHANDISAKTDHQIQRQAAEEEEELQMNRQQPTIQQQALEEEEELQMKSAEEEEEAPLQMSRSGSAPGGDRSLSTYLNRSKKSGKPLDSATNARMSGAFGYDFSNVKVHNDKKANDISQGIGANAFTKGNHIYFNEGKYKPGTMNGDHLLSHELTHVVQQSGGLSRSMAFKQLSISKPGDPYEQQADSVSDIVTKALHHPSSESVPGNDISRDEQSVSRISLSDAILHRKVKSGIPEIQKDGGTTVAIIGLIVSTATWAAGQGGSFPRTVDPRLERIAEPSTDREQYRSEHPFRKKRWANFFDETIEGPAFDSRWYVSLRWQFNGSELTDVHMTQGLENYIHWDSTHARLVMIDNQASNKKIGFRCEFEWDPASFGHYLYQCDGWISADGSGWRSAWRTHEY